jgi:hypothetical protein
MKNVKRPSLLAEQSASTSVIKHMGISEFSATFDYVMVFKMDEDNNGVPSQSAAAKTCMNAMLSAGLEIFPYLSVQKDELYVLIRAPVSSFAL